MNEDYLYIWFCNRKVKNDFLAINKLQRAYPIIEYLIAAYTIQKSDQRGYFKVKQVQRILYEYGLPHHEQTIYCTTRYLIQNNFVNHVIGRQCFTAQKLHINLRGLELLSLFQDQLKNQSNLELNQAL